MGVNNIWERRGSPVGEREIEWVTVWRGRGEKRQLQSGLRLIPTGRCLFRAAHQGRQKEQSESKTRAGGARWKSDLRFDGVSKGLGLVICSFKLSLNVYPMSCPCRTLRVGPYDAVRTMGGLLLHVSGTTEVHSVQTGGAFGQAITVLCRAHPQCLSDRVACEFRCFPNIQWNTKDKNAAVQKEHLWGYWNVEWEATCRRWTCLLGKYI